MKIKPEALLFDLDGVLVDSIDAWWYSLNEAFEKYNEKPISLEEFKKIYWGHDLFYNIEKNNLSFEIGNECNKLYYKHLDKVKMFPEVDSVLNSLKNYKKCLVTNTPRDSTSKILEKLKIDKYFTKVFTSNDVKIAKPNPEIIFLACDFLQIKPEEAVLIGDTESDILAGRNANCKIIGVRINGDYRIESLDELKNILLN